VPQSIQPLNKHLRVIVAERCLRINDTRDVWVRIGAPRPSGGDWRCPYAITGLGQTIVAESMGVDSMQALQLAFAWIRSYLTPKKSSLVWLRKGDGLGFPRQVPENLGQALEDQVERLIEGTAKRQGKRRASKRKRTARNATRKSH
jgi:hypothetical protein